MKNRNNLNIYLTVILIAATLFSLLTIYASSTAPEARRSLHLSARSATLYEPETKTFLYKNKENLRLPMASTTKIMPALVAIENAALEDIVTVSANAAAVEGSKAYFSVGEEATLEEMLYALMLGSANDAAIAIAEHIAGGVDDFAVLMNKKAESIGLADTSFSNPHGLDADDHYTTAHDLALLAAEYLKNPILKSISSTYKKTFSVGLRTKTYVNHNKLLRLYDGSVGMKTGFTKKSGRCLVGAAERDGLTFITVTLDAPNDWSDHRDMLNYGYDTLEKICFAKPGEYSYQISMLGSEAGTVTVENTEGLEMIVNKDEHKIEEFIKLSRFATAPVKEGDILGKVIFTLDGEAVGEVDLKALSSVDIKKGESFFKKLFKNN